MDDSNFEVYSAGLAKMIFIIVVAVKGLLQLKLWLIILTCILIGLVPMGGTIAFIIFKLTGVLSVSWWWIILMIITDCVIVDYYLRNEG